MKIYGSDVISLRLVTKLNYEAVCDLQVSEEQEKYVACNMWSLLESSFNEGYECRAVYLGSDPVGFIMWVREREDKIAIWRFMIDQKSQGQGIGRESLALALTEIKARSGLKEIEICYDPKNAVAKEFYESFGFVELGMDAEGEDMLAKIIL